MPKLSDLFKEAMDAPEGGWQPAEGEVFLVKVVDSRSRVRDSGLPMWSLWLEVQSGENAGNRFWTHLFLTSHPGVNRRILTSLQGMGLSEEFLFSDPSPEMVAAALRDRVFSVEAHYRPNKNDPDSPWHNHVFFGGDEETSEDLPADDYDDDDDDAF